MDGSNFAVRHSDTGYPADDLVVGIAEAQEQLAIATLADARIASAANAATIAAQAASGVATATSPQLADKGHAINTSGKALGKVVLNTTSNLFWYALGSSDTSKWRPFSATDSSGDVTPS